MILFVQIDGPVPAGLFGRLLADWGVPHATWCPDREPPPQPQRFAGLIVLGGYMGVHDAPRFPHLNRVRDFMDLARACEVPLLGICLGGQLLAALLGGTVHADRRGERGCRCVRLTQAGEEDPLFTGLPKEFPVFQWHNDSFTVPESAVHLAASAECAGQAIRSGLAWGIQFHPEVDAEIVEAWRIHCGAGPEVLNEFNDRQAALRRVAERLLGNFLQIAAHRTEAESTLNTPVLF